MIIDDIKRAIETNAEIKIEYVNGNGEVSERVLSGVEYSRSWGSTHIEAFDSKNQECRCFKIERIQSVSFVDDFGIHESQSKESNPHDNGIYQFNPSKPIFKLYGVEY